MVLIGIDSSRAAVTAAREKVIITVQVEDDESGLCIERVLGI